MPLRFSTKSLFSSIFIIMVLGLGFFLAGIIIVGSLTIRESTEHALNERLRLAEVIASRVDDYMNDSIRKVEIMVESEKIGQKLDDQAEQQRFVESVRRQLGGLAYYVVLLDIDHKILALDPLNEEVLANDFSSAKCVEFVHVNEKPVITRAFELGAPTPTVAMVVPVWAPDGQLNAVVFTALNLNHNSFTKLLTDVGPGSTGYAEIVDSAGMVLGSTMPDLLWQKDDHSGQFDALITENKSVVGTCHRCHVEDATVIARNDDVMAFAPLLAARWGVALRQSKAETFAFSGTLQSRITLFGVVALLVMGVITWQLLRRIVQPIQELTDACQEIAQGNLSASIPQGGTGEVGRLGTAFDFMRRRLKASLDEIQGWTVELEDRIRHRTQELEESQKQLLAANQELSVLNTVGDALRQSLDLNSTLNTALERMMELTGAQTGCVFLIGQASGESVVAAHSSKEANEIRPCAYSSVTRAVNEVFEKGRTDVFKIPLEGVPSGNGSSQPGENYYLLTCIPLVGKESLPGVMVLMKKDDCSFSIHDRQLFASIGAQIGISIENALLFKALLQKETSLSELLHKVIVAQEEERRRIARELHDETSQTLTALGVGLKTAIMAPAVKPEDVKERLVPLGSMATGMLKEVSRMIQDLRPSILDDLGLISAIDWYADIRLKSKGIHVSWEVIGTERRLITELETTLFRIAQEAISNIAKHADAENVNIVLEFSERRVILVIEDDGRGFDLQSILASGRSSSAYGLVGMRERVDLFGGVLSIESKVGEGTSIQVEIPNESPFPTVHSHNHGSSYEKNQSFAR
jgi:signal transduction histidine kinase